MNVRPVPFAAAGQTPHRGAGRRITLAQAGRTLVLRGADRLRAARVAGPAARIRPRAEIAHHNPSPADRLAQFRDRGGRSEFDQWAATNDLVLQLRKRGIQRIILGGMLANMCVESHMRHLIEEGFEVAVVRDATAGPRHPVWGDGYQAAIINYRFFAHALLSTDEVLDRMH
ncbi:isochorismatase family protein [Streptomyces olivochromogenes]|uniref:isochorismatase family protein n=1 Tax=Streptomyces olivochromogenes TaxID=1963 RepID=UPI001F28FBA2|nr:isochorismatase family protein [Streptomyces olivochromogenes]